MLIDYVLGDDWHGVFVDGELYAEDHSISDDRWIFLMQKIVFENVEELEVRKWDVNYEWMDCMSHFPYLFDEIGEENLELM